MASNQLQFGHDGSIGPVPFGLLSASSIEAYIQSVTTIPALSINEEQQLATLVRSQKDTKAAQTLILSNLWFVIFIARRYLGYGLPLPDLIQEGNVGLIKALKRFDPEQGVRLTSFAVHWIRAEIHEFIIRNWRIVKLATTKSKRKLFFKIRKYSKHSGRMNHTEVEKAATDLNVTIKDVLEIEAHIGSAELSINAPGSKPIRGYIPEYLLKDETNEYQAIEDADWIAHRRKRLAEGLKTLDARSLDIIHRRWIHSPETTRLEDLAAEYKVSAERIRQIQDAAFQKLRLHLQKERA